PTPRCRYRNSIFIDELFDVRHGEPATLANRDKPNLARPHHAAECLHRHTEHLRNILRRVKNALCHGPTILPSPLDRDSPPAHREDGGPTGLYRNREAVEYLADTLKKDVDALKDWFNAAHDRHDRHVEAKGNGPRAVT
ncbi:MAG: hypothetical protein O7F69_10420, partial [Alphaproteobacteria bacterium]|nr:hypothetical protein [Alphaproteobacteria bacterium]